MFSSLEGKNIVLGVTGSIACYKALDLASKLVQEDALVDVVMSYGATQFVTPLAFRSLTHRAVVTRSFNAESEMSVEHVSLAQRADIVVVAPATAHTLAKMALGLADDPLTTTLLATRAPVLVAPTMDAHMYDNPVTQENLGKLKARGVVVVGPAQGRLASGLVGMGRLVETPDLIGHIKAVLGRKGDLAGRTIVVSAGGTREPIDPVRIIGNRSSGKMGYALAEAARDRGAHTVLISTATGLADPAAVDVLHVETAMEMKNAVHEAVSKGADALIMAAAVADYMPAESLARKFKKEAQEWDLRLVRTPDILKEASGSLIKVGFAAESEQVVENARDKLLKKGLHLIVANDITTSQGGFGADTNKVWLIGKEGDVEELPLMSKYEVAHHVLDRVATLLKSRSS